MPAHQCQKCKRLFIADAEWKRICLDCWKQSKGIHNKRKQEQSAWRPPPPQPPLIEADMLRRLIYLCHPDKHSNSQASHIATDWLLKQRKP